MMGGEWKKCYSSFSGENCVWGVLLLGKIWGNRVHFGVTSHHPSKSVTLCVSVAFFFFLFFNFFFFNTIWCGYAWTLFVSMRSMRLTGLGKTSQFRANIFHTIMYNIWIKLFPFSLLVFNLECIYNIFYIILFLWQIFCAYEHFSSWFFLSLLSNILLQSRLTRRIIMFVWPMNVYSSCAANIWIEAQHQQCLKENQFSPLLYHQYQLYGKVGVGEFMSMKVAQICLFTCWAQNRIRVNWSYMMLTWNVLKEFRGTGNGTRIVFHRSAPKSLSPYNRRKSGRRNN